MTASANKSEKFNLLFTDSILNAFSINSMGEVQITFQPANNEQLRIMAAKLIKEASIYPTRRHSISIEFEPIINE